MIIKIPVKPHVKHFLSNTVGDPYPMSGHDELGIFLFTLFRRPVRKNCRIENLGRYTAKFSVVLSDKQVFDYGCNYLDPNSIVVFNTKVDDLINTLFLAVVEARVDLDERINDAIRYFLDKYDYFDMDEMNFEMLKKRYYRYRVKQAKNINIIKKPPRQQSIKFA